MRNLSLVAAAALVAGCLLAGPPAAFAFELLAFTDGAAPGDMLGDKVADAGDLNGDGRRDYAAAANASDAGGEGSGEVLVFFGASPPNGAPELTVVGQAGDLLGSALAGAGDLNADGFGDLAIGSWRNSDAGDQAGKVLVLFGGDPPDAAPDRTLFGPEAGAQLGRAVAGVGDLNGDGHADLAAGAPGEGAGRVFIYYGGSAFDTTADLILEGVEAGERFGIALASPGDLDGDGEDDLAVGADRANVTAAWSGAVRLFAGGPGIDVTPDLMLAGETAGSFFGGALAGAGDVNGDGEIDLVVGARGYNGPSTDSGRAYVFLGGPGLDAVPDLPIDGQGFEEFLGTSVAGGSDLNRDGDHDLVIGAPGADGRRGEVRVYYGGSPLDAVPDVLLPGEAGGDEMGFSVASVRDSDLNGAGEVLAGAWGHGSLAGRIYLYGDSMPPVAVEPIEAPNAAPAFAVGPLRPNPSSGSGDIELPLVLDRPSRLLVELLDVRGRRIARLHDRQLPAGVQVVEAGIGGEARPAGGVYLLRVTRGAESITRKLVVVP